MTREIIHKVISQQVVVVNNDSKFIDTKITYNEIFNVIKVEVSLKKQSRRSKR